MKLLTLAIDDKKQISITGDLSLPNAKQIIEAIMIDAAINQAEQALRHKIREGFRRVRHGKTLDTKGD